MRSAAAVLCAAVLSAATALQPGALQPGPRHLYISGVDASGTDAEVIAALGGESAVEDVALDLVDLADDEPSAVTLQLNGVRFEEQTL